VRIDQRLFLTLLPAFLGLLLVVALAYWGQYARQAPHLAVVTAAIALIGSLLLAWRNARYIALRIQRLAARRAGDDAPMMTDELETIEHAVDHLQTEVAQAREEQSRRYANLEAERREMAHFMAEASQAATRAVDEVRLPVHILLENRFGDLNENQEEMLGSAQAAAEEAAVLLRRLRLVADLDRGAVEFRHDPIRLDEIVNGILPMLEAEGERRQVRVTTDLAPALPRVRGDRTHLQEALAHLLTSAVRRTPAGAEVRISSERVEDAVRLTVRHGSGDVPVLDHLLSRWLLRSLGVTVITADSTATAIDLPAVVFSA
jgi:signal transduction histidine kinase